MRASADSRSPLQTGPNNPSSHTEDDARIVHARSTQFHASPSPIVPLHLPAEFLRIARAFSEFSEGVVLPLVHRPPCETSSQGHLINQRLKRRALSPLAGKMYVRPSPKCRCGNRSYDLASRNREAHHGMSGHSERSRRRKSHPNAASARIQSSPCCSLDSKNRPVPQIPGDSLPANFHTPRHSFSPIRILTYLQKNGLAPRSLIRPPFEPRLSMEIPGSKSLVPSRGNHVAKPAGLPLRIPRAPALPRIHYQIPKPQAPLPSPTHPQKPNLIPPPHRKRGEPLIERLHVTGRITPQRLVQTNAAITAA